MQCICVFVFNQQKQNIVAWFPFICLFRLLSYSRKLTRISKSFLRLSVLSFGNMGGEAHGAADVLYNLGRILWNIFFYSRRKGLRTKDQTKEVDRQWDSKWMQSTGGKKEACHCSLYSAKLTVLILARESTIRLDTSVSPSQCAATD